MTIRAKLQLNTIVQILLVGVVAAALVAAYYSNDRSNTKATRIAAINEDLTQIRFVTFENLLHYDARSLEQWQAKYADLSILLQPLPLHTPTERRILADILAQHQAIRPLFDRLIASYDPTPTTSTPTTLPTTVLRDFQERLAGQLLVKQQTQVSDLAELSTLNRQELNNQRLQSSLIVGIAIALMALVTVLSSIRIAATISRALAILQLGAETISGGHLDYRLPSMRTNDEFKRLATAFNAMAAHLEQTETIKTEFTMLASHQLRTPATAVKGFLSLLLQGYSGRLRPQQAEQIAAAYAENETQLRVIEQILEVVKADSGQNLLHSSTVNLGSLLAQVARHHAAGLKARHQTLTVHQPKQPLAVTADAEKLAIVLSSLIDNAIKYSPEGAKINLTLSGRSAKPGHPDAAVIQLQDNGYGISLSDQKNLFTKFARFANPNSIPAGGSGLGLYLAKNIVKLHRGTLDLSSRPDHGTTVTLTLPL